MKLVICNSKNWFHLNNNISQNYEILNIKDKCDLNLRKLEKFSPDLIFFPHWHWIVKKEIFSTFTCIVFHTAPLPYGRGGSPIQNLIMQGYKSSPVCAIKMSEGVDDGPIYDKEIISLEGTLKEILCRLNTATNKLIQKLILNLPKPKAQKGNAVVFKRLINKDNEINLNETIDQVYNKIRMLDENSYPSAFLNLKNVCIEFSEISKFNNRLNCKVSIFKKEDN
jgi:methionyl-tRNA formyltransferase